MQDMKASAEKLRAEANYAEQIARSATAVQKRELYERLAAHSDNSLSKSKRRWQTDPTKTVSRYLPYLRVMPRPRFPALR
jgi:hypothetical protein